MVPFRIFTWYFSWFPGQHLCMTVQHSQKCCGSSFQQQQTESLEVSQVLKIDVEFSVQLCMQIFFTSLVFPIATLQISTDKDIEINVIIILIFAPLHFAKESMEALSVHVLFSYFLQGSLSSVNWLCSLKYNNIRRATLATPISRDSPLSKRGKL